MAKSKATCAKPAAEFQTADKLDLADPKPGLYLGVPLVDYLLIDAFSKSGATEILKSPSHYQTYKEEGIDTDAIRLGSLVDDILFDPAIVADTYVQAPLEYKNDKGDMKLWARRGNSNAARAYGAELTDNGRILMVKREAFEDGFAMVAAIRSFPPIARILAQGIPQVTMIWIDPATGILCRARPDWWRPDYTTDLKTILAGGAEQTRWPREVKKNGYHVQAGAYTSGRTILCGGEIVPFKFIVVEKNKPYARMAYRTGTATMRKGENDWNRALAIFAECGDQGRWDRGYSDAEEVFELHSYDLVEHMTANDESEEEIGI